MRSFLTIFLAGATACLAFAILGQELSGAPVSRDEAPRPGITE